jgi:hypothetical protein
MGQPQLGRRDPAAGCCKQPRGQGQPHPAWAPGTGAVEDQAGSQRAQDDHGGLRPAKVQVTATCTETNSAKGVDHLGRPV